MAPLDICTVNHRFHRYKAYAWTLTRIEELQSIWQILIKWKSGLENVTSRNLLVSKSFYFCIRVHTVAYAPFTDMQHTYQSHKYREWAKKVSCYFGGVTSSIMDQFKRNSTVRKSTKFSERCM